MFFTVTAQEGCNICLGKLGDSEKVFRVLFILKENYEKDTK